MLVFTVKIANKAFCVKANFEKTKYYCENYLFQGTEDCLIEITSSDIEFEREQFTNINEIDRIRSDIRSDSYLEIIALQRKITESLFEHNTLLFHGSVVSVDGKAYLFTAKSGTGKSTHTRLWREMLGDRAVMVNDDKPFISVIDGNIVVHGSPWNGKHKLGGNISVPLRAICILERGEYNEIQPIAAAKALPMLIQQSSRPRAAELMPKYMELLDGIAKGVRFYRLSCNMEPEAARVSYMGMSQDD